MKKILFLVSLCFIVTGMLFSQSRNFEDDVNQIKAFARRYPYVKIQFLFQAEQVLEIKKNQVIGPPPIGSYRFDISSTASGNTYLHEPNSIEYEFTNNREEFLVRGYQGITLAGHYFSIYFNFFTGLSVSMRRGTTSYIETRNLNVDIYIEHFLEICDTQIPGLDF